MKGWWRSRSFIDVLLCGAIFGGTMIMPVFWPVAIIAIAVGITLVERSKSIAEALVHAYLFGFGFCSVSLSFLLLAYPTDWLGLSDMWTGMFIVVGVWLLCSIPVPLSLLPWGAAIFVLRKRPAYLKISIGALLWVFCELLRSAFSTLILWAPGVPIGTHIAFTLTGLSLSGSSGLMWFAYIGGFWTLAGVAYVLAASLAEAYQRWRCVSLQYATYIALPVIGICILSYIVPPALRTELNVSTIHISTSTTVALVRTDFARSGKLSIEDERNKAEIINEKIHHFASTLVKGDVIVLPEDSRFFIFSKYLAAGELAETEALLSEKGITLVDSGRTEVWDGAYSIVRIDSPGTNIPVYSVRKTLLAAFGEYMPSIFAFVGRFGFERGFKTYEETRAYLPAEKPFDPREHVFSAGGIRFGVLACSEVLSTQLYASLGKEADVLLNVSSLASGKGSPVMFNQFLGMAKVHAVVAKRTYLQATNFGPNILIEPKLSSTKVF